MSDADRLVLVARVSGAFGVRGEVRIRTYTDSPLAVLNFRNLKQANGQAGLTLVSGRSFKEGLIARAKEIATKEEADAMRGLLLHVAREALPQPQEDEYYLTDLIGMAAVTPEGQVLGRIKAVQDFGAGDILEIDPGRGAATWYLPFTREAAPEVDIAGGKVVVVRPPETSEREV